MRVTVLGKRKVRLSSGLNPHQECIIAVSSVKLKVRMALRDHLDKKQMHLSNKDLLKNVLVSTMLKPFT